MVFNLKAQCLVILLVTFYFGDDISNRENCLNCHGKCADLDFENCENECCTHETEKRVVCYFTSWSSYRKGIARFDPEDIDISLCTHINYAFAFLDNKTFTVKPSDPWLDVDNAFYERVVSLEKPVLLSIGGWTNSGPEAGWGVMFSNAASRAKFIKSTIEILERYNFSGVDLDYEYPACPQGNRTAGSPIEKKYFNKLTTELKQAMGGKYVVTVTISSGKETLQECYDITELCGIPDWINVMAYDYHITSEKFFGANAPLCGTSDNWGVSCCQYETLCYLTSVAHCPANRLVLGIPFYGHSYTLAPSSEPDFGAVTVGPGEAGQYTKSNGSLAYFEICLNQNHGWKSGWSPANDSYAWNGNQIVTFDSIRDIKRKSCFINKYFKLGGAMIWAIDYDDHSNSCGCGPHPLLRTINRQLRCQKGPCTECN